MRRLIRSRCERRGHDWFPGGADREFIVVTGLCLRCRTPYASLPWGECFGGHPIAEHYNAEGDLVPHATCPGPR